MANNRSTDIIGSLISFFAFLVCLVALIVDTVLFVTARSRINDAFPGSPGGPRDTAQGRVNTKCAGFLDSLPI